MLNIYQNSTSKISFMLVCILLISKLNCGELKLTEGSTTNIRVADKNGKPTGEVFKLEKDFCEPFIFTELVYSSGNMNRVGKAGITFTAPENMILFTSESDKIVSGSQILSLAKGQTLKVNFYEGPESEFKTSPGDYEGNLNSINSLLNESGKYFSDMIYMTTYEPNVELDVMMEAVFNKNQEVMAKLEQADKNSFDKIKAPSDNPDNRVNSEKAKNKDLKNLNDFADISKNFKYLFGEDFNEQDIIDRINVYIKNTTEMINTSDFYNQLPEISGTCYNKYIDPLFDGDKMVWFALLETSLLGNPKSFKMSSLDSISYLMPSYLFYLFKLDPEKMKFHDESNNFFSLLEFHFASLISNLMEYAESKEKTISDNSLKSILGPKYDTLVNGALSAIIDNSDSTILKYHNSGTSYLKACAEVMGGYDDFFNNEGKLVMPKVLKLMGMSFAMSSDNYDVPVASGLTTFDTRRILI